MNPRDALYQQQLLKDNLSKPGYVDFLQYWIDDVARKKAGPVITDEEGRPSGMSMSQQQQRLLEMADTYYVSAEMMMVAQAAATGLDGLDRFSHDLWPSDAGFLLIQGSLVTTDIWGQDLVTTAISWIRRSMDRHPGTLLFEYTTMDDPRDRASKEVPQEKRDQIAADMGRLSLAHMIWIADEQRVGPQELVAPEDYQQYALEGQQVQLSTNHNRIYLALLMLLNQSIVTKTKHDLRPANPKRARKMKVPGQVTVITLRHSSGSQRQDGETHVEWQHRWIVKGHWRSQACGPDYPLAQEIAPGKYRARIYIAPFIKGPEDKPLVQTTKIYSLTR